MKYDYLMSPLHRENGSVLFLILIAVVLFAALSYAVTQSTRGGGIEPSEEKAELLAVEIINYATAIQTAITRLQVSNGCEDTEISFENNEIAGYTNNRSPNDNSCHIFHPNGGGISWRSMNPDWLDQTFSASANFGNPQFTSKVSVIRVGRECTFGADPLCRELMIIIPYVRKIICDAINQNMTGRSTDIDNFGAFAYNGTHLFNHGVDYDHGGYTAIGNYGTPDHVGEYTACFEGAGILNPSDSYYFYAVLIAR